MRRGLYERCSRVFRLESSFERIIIILLNDLLFYSVSTKESMEDAFSTPSDFDSMEEFHNLNLLIQKAFCVCLNVISALCILLIFYLHLLTTSTFSLIRLYQYRLYHSGTRNPCLGLAMSGGPPRTYNFFHPFIRKTFYLTFFYESIY